MKKPFNKPGDCLFKPGYQVLLCFLLYGCLFPFPVSAQQVVSGRVVQVSATEYEFQISPDNQLPDTIQETPQIVVRLSKRYFQEQGNGTPVFPASVRPRNRIKAWGEWKTTEKEVFLAWKIETWPGHDRKDPTGIRSRLRRMLHLPVTVENDPGGPGGSGGNASGTGPGGPGGGGGPGGAGGGGGGAGGGGPGGGGGGPGGGK